MIELPEKIKSILGSSVCNSDTVGMSGASVLLFDDKVLKIDKICEATENERNVMLWLKDKLPVPEVICHEIYNGRSYLLMSRLPGVMLCDESYLTRPQELTQILAAGLKMFWETDISNCPYHCNLDKKLEMARYNVEHDLVDVNNVEPETFGENGFQSPLRLLDWLEHNRPEEDIVFSHGDYCLPNIFIEDGEISGFLDLGYTGCADRYQDIALCYRSLKHNYEGKYGGEIYEGFDPDNLFELKWVSWASTVVFLLSYLLYAEVLRENTYLSRTVEVQENQMVIDTGLYGIVRHPMYSVTIILFLSMPLVLGSLISFVIFLAYPVIISLRICNEEKVLEEGLAGYAEYKKKVKYRVIPFLW